MQTKPIVDASFSALDALLSSAFKPDGPGAAVMVVKNGQALLKKGYGLANIEWNIPVGPDTVFRIGSVTKQFTSAMILMLECEGKLSLADPVEKFFPKYPTHGHTITVEQLLNHTSGIKSYTSLPEWEPLQGKDLKLEELIDLFKLQPMDFAPGKKWSYNNSAYVLLSGIIEKVAGMSYSEFLAQRITGPLGMNQTTLELPRLVIPRRAAGYAMEEEKYTNAAYLSMTHPLGAGSMVSTVEDLAKWDTALNNGQVLPLEVLKRAFTPCNLPDGKNTHYGFGWGLHEWHGMQVTEHGGGINGFACHERRVPEAGVFAVCLTNQIPPLKDPGEVTLRAAALALGIELSEPQPVQVRVDELARVAGIYEPEPEVELIFTPAEGMLKISGTWFPKEQDVLPLGGDTYYRKESPFDKIRFVVDEQGKVTVMEIHNSYGEVDLSAKRTEKPLPSY